MVSAVGTGRGIFGLVGQFRVVSGGSGETLDESSPAILEFALE